MKQDGSHHKHNKHNMYGTRCHSHNHILNTAVYDTRQHSHNHTLNITFMVQDVTVTIIY